MKKLLYLIAIFCALKANAQNYLISFAGTGASSSVASVKVENLTSGAFLTLNGNDILRLNITTGISSVDKELSSELKVYPNPMSGNSVIQVYPPAAGDANIAIYEISGKLVTQIHSYLDNCIQEFSLSGLKDGLYIVIVTGNNYKFSGKLVCNRKSGETISIQKKSNNAQADVDKISKTVHKGAVSSLDMPYATGDRLKFTGISGIYSKVMIDIPTLDKTITFNFIACSDGDNNNYPVVEIGTQTWMAENLKTTKYNNGTTVIPLVIDNTAWTSLSTPGYCWYNNDEATYKNVYGALYNWYTVNTAGLCPVGWHVPTDAEWTTLANYVGGIAGTLKETGTTHWQGPNSGATNETGFTALPGGYRYSVLHLGTFDAIGYDGDFWSASEFSTANGLDYWLGYSDTYISRENDSKNVGFSVRCIKN